MKRHWSCTNCGYLVEAEIPPDQCPACRQKCEFRDATCYIPECGGPDSGTFDPRLVGKGGKGEGK